MSSSPRSPFSLAALLLASCAHDLSFLDPRDAATADARADVAPMCNIEPGQGPCDPVANCGCGDGQTCAAPDLDQPRARCVTIGSQPESSLCLGAGECRSGLSCFRFTCRRSCRASSDCRADERCVTDEPTTSVGACTRTQECTVAPSAGCTGGVHCRVEALSGVGGGGSIGVAWCEELNGTGREGDNCERDGCVDGLHCDGSGAGFRCVRPCTDGAQCSSAALPRCDRTSSPVVIGEVTWGVCAPP